jgi:myo-inositol-1(or 4)-monophosphatase
MVYVAAGRLDAGWCRPQHHTSLAAAQLILLESGALLSDPQGNPQTQGSKELLFANPKCFKHLLQIRQSLTA